MRLCAHRTASGSKETCTDTELVVPVAPLDRTKLAAAIDAITPQGDTPLVHSIVRHSRRRAVSERGRQRWPPAGLLRSVATAAARYPFTVLDNRGPTVATGSSDASPVELPPGRYTIVVHATGGDVISKPQQVTASQDAVVTMNGPRNRPILQP